MRDILKMVPALTFLLVGFLALARLTSWRICVVLGLLATVLTLPLWWPWWRCAC